MLEQLRQHPIARLANGFGAFFRGFLFINQHRLWRYIFWPSLLSLGLAVLLLIGVYTGISALILRGWPGGTGLGASIYSILIHGAAILVAFFVTLFSYQLLASILVIPFLGPLLAKVEIILTGQAIEVSLGQDLRNALLSLWIGLRDLVVQLALLGLSLLLGPFQPVLMVLVGSFFLGRGSFDFLLEKFSASLPERNQKTRRFWPEITGLGLANFLVLLIPLLGVLFAPASSLVGASLLFYNHHEISRH